ncbi:hypothetical protein F4806DRAFT_453683 [Annulohypoxylon nitens]|nr:hypothetical protein F4806DRAFT_453683 [Annulohypoxylon nitens]
MKDWDPQSEFKRSLDRFPCYPRNLIDPHHRDTESISERLGTNINRVFTFDKPSSLKVIELHSGDKEFEDYNVDDVKSHFNPNIKDPLCRIVLLQSDANQSPALHCSEKQLLYLLSHHQVPPSILEIFIPAAEKSPKPHHFSAVFGEYDTLSNLYEDQLVLKALDRSGVLIRRCFCFHLTKDDLSLQHCVAYYSYDIRTRRTFWLIISSDNDFLKVIEGMTRYDDSHDAAHLANDCSSPDKSLRGIFTVLGFFLERAGQCWKKHILKSIAQRKAIVESHATATKQTSSQLLLSPPSYFQKNLQDLNHLEEKALELHLQIEQNLTITKDMKDSNSTLMASTMLKEQLKTSACSEAFFQQASNTERGLKSTLLEIKCHLDQIRITRTDLVREETNRRQFQIAVILVFILVALLIIFICLIYLSDTRKPA